MPRGDGARGQPDGVRYRLSERQERGKRGARVDPSGYDAGKKINGKKRHILVDTVVCCFTPLFIRPISRTAMVPFRSLEPCSADIHF